MSRQLAWVLTAVAALAACGGDRKSELDRPVTNPTARPAPVQGAAAGAGDASTAAEKAAPAQPTAVAEELVTPSERLYTVQIASYRSADAARALATKLEQRGLPVWTAEVKVGDVTYHRIRVGAHPSLREMRKLGSRISTQFKQEVWVAPVERSVRIPENAVAETKALLAR